MATIPSNGIFTHLSDTHERAQLHTGARQQHLMMYSGSSAYIHIYAATRSERAPGALYFLDARPRDSELSRPPPLTAATSTYYWSLDDADIGNSFSLNAARFFDDAMALVFPTAYGILPTTIPFTVHSAAKSLPLPLHFATKAAVPALRAIELKTLTETVTGDFVFSMPMNTLTYTLSFSARVAYVTAKPRMRYTIQLFFGASHSPHRSPRADHVSQEYRCPSARHQTVKPCHRASQHIGLIS